jgi:hypothetical protein
LSKKEYCSSLYLRPTKEEHTMTVGQFVIAHILVTPTRTHRHEDDETTQKLRELLSEIKKLRKRRILLRFKYKKDNHWKEEWGNLVGTLRILYKEFSLINKRRHNLKKGL